MQIEEVRPRSPDRPGGFFNAGGRDVIDLELAAGLQQLADDIRRMRPPMNSNPEAFHIDRSELASRARRLAERCKTGAPIAAADVPAPIGRQATRRHQVVDLEGRSVLVLTRSSIDVRQESCRRRILGRLPLNP
jgi:hypothetical protein